MTSTHAERGARSKEVRACPGEVGLSASGRTRSSPLGEIAIHFHIAPVPRHGAVTSVTLTRMPRMGL
jgi:hypothetical protein